MASEGPDPSDYGQLPSFLEFFYAHERGATAREATRALRDLLAAVTDRIDEGHPAAGSMTITVKVSPIKDRLVDFDIDVKTAPPRQKHSATFYVDAHHLPAQFDPFGLQFQFDTQDMTGHTARSQTVHDLTD